MAKEVKDIRTAVAEQLAKISERVISSVSETLVDRGLKRRADAIVSCLDQLDKAELELKRLGPDDIKYSIDGKPSDEFFTKKRIDERNKCQGKINKLIKAINKAIESGIYDDVYNLAAGKDTPENKTTDSGDDNTADS